MTIHTLRDVIDMLESFIRGNYVDCPEIMKRYNVPDDFWTSQENIDPQIRIYASGKSTRETWLQAKEYWVRAYCNIEVRGHYAKISDVVKRIEAILYTTPPSGYDSIQILDETPVSISNYFSVYILHCVVQYQNS